jgi:hypothetical protein
MPSPYYIVSTYELPKNAAGAAYIPNGLDPAQVSGAPGTATAGQFAASPFGPIPAPVEVNQAGTPTGRGSVMLPAYPDRPTAERQSLAQNTALVSSVSPASPSHVAGTAITITGARFTGVVPATGVTIGGVVCTGVVVVSDSTITALVGATNAAGAANVVVTNPQGAGPAYAITLT